MAKRPPRKGKVEIDTHGNTLLIDGNALFKVGYHGAIREVNWRGEKIGGIYQFITVLRKLLLEDLYHKVYVVWDGHLSGKLRYEIYSDYKISRGKNYQTGQRTTEPDPDFISQQITVKKYLEELFVRQVEDELVEGDDLIAYYCKNKRKNEKITICTNDRDICQLISEDVRVYLCDKKEFVTPENYNQFFKHHLSNLTLVKTIIGDTADDIKGIKGVQEKTLLTNFPDIITRTITLDEIIEQAKQIQLDRAKNKKKPLEAIQNIIEAKTTGIQGTKVYEINNRIIDLKNPLLTASCERMMNTYMKFPMNPDGRALKTVYSYIKSDGLTRLIGTNNLADYLLPFKKLADREKKNFDNY